MTRTCVPSISPSGIAFYTGDRFPGWKSSLFVGALNGLQLQRVSFNQPSQAERREPLFARLVRRCLEKDPGKRFQSASDLRFALESASDVAASAHPVKKADEKSIAVLPFANMSADAEDQYFSDGLAEELINALTRLPGLRVASRTSAFRFRGGDVDIRQVGRDLQVSTVVEGSVRRAGSRLRVILSAVSSLRSPVAIRCSRALCLDGGRANTRRSERGCNLHSRTLLSSL